jgi:hypothetical protein
MATLSGTQTQHNTNTISATGIADTIDLSVPATDVTVDNDGLIVSTGSFAIGTTGTASGGTPVVTIANTGTIHGAKDAVHLAFNTPGGTVTIGNSGLIETDGLTAVSIGGTAATTFTNSGRIFAPGGTAIAFGGGNDTLSLTTGSVIEGVIDGGGGTNTVTLSGSGVFGGAVNFQSLAVASGSWSVSGDDIYQTQVSVGAGATLEDAGELSLASSRFLNDGTYLVDAGASLTLTGTVVADGGASGTFVIGTGGTVMFSDGVAASQTVLLNGGSDDVIVDTASTDGMSGFAGSIQGFVASDTIDLQNVTYHKDDKLTFAGGTLDVVESGVTLAAIAVGGAHKAGDFKVGNDGIGGTAITALACFTPGTAIATASGWAAVETLGVGSVVRLAAGGTAPVVWVGQRDVDCARHPDPESVWPVRVRAGAFAHGVPLRDLLLSPDHAVFSDGVLIPVKYLVNGTTVTQERVATVRYHHVELARHDVILAEGLPAESYLDSGDRWAFAGPVQALHPRFGGAPLTAPPTAPPTGPMAGMMAAPMAWEARGCAPLVVTGAPVERVRADLAARATRAAQAAALRLRA